MIGQLRGTVVHHDLQTLTLDVGGVGYELEVPISVLTQNLGHDAGQNVAPRPDAAENRDSDAQAVDASPRGKPRERVLYTHLVVREDAHQLFGFATRSDRDVFRRLIRVNGIGARLGLAMLSSFSASELAAAIERGDVAALTRIPGVGKKTAERVILELAGKLDPMVRTLPGVSSGAVGLSGAPEAQAGDANALRESDARAALEALGYKPADVDRMLAGVRADPSLADQPAEAWVRAALRATVVPSRSPAGPGARRSTGGA